MNGPVLEVCFSHVIHSVADFWIEKIMSYHRIKKCTLYIDIVVTKFENIIFDVLPTFSIPSSSKKSLENFCLLQRSITIS